MTKQEIIELIEDMLEVDAGTIKEDMKLADIEEWDSMAYLYFKVLVKDKLGKEITSTEIKNYQTVQELLDVMS